MNEYYSHAGYPATNASGSSASMRAELDSIAAGFDKLPPLAGNALKTIRVNAAGTALETSNAVSIPVTSLILKGDGAGGLSTAASGTDYAPATSGTALLKGNGSGGFSSAGAVPNGLMKGDGSSVSAATAGTDYLAPAAIGVTVQAYDANTAKTNATQTFTAKQTFGDIEATGTVTGFGGGGGSGQCRLTKSGANLLLSPFNGNKLIINGAVQTIPSAGVTLAAPATSGTTYYIYAYMSGATVTLEYSTTGHTTDSTTGVEIKSGDATRTLVGMARTVSNAWVDTQSQRFIISWFNRVLVVAQKSLTSTTSTSSASFVELSSSDRAEFICWAGDVRYNVTGSCALNSGSQMQTIVWRDGSALTPGIGASFGTSATHLWPAVAESHYPDGEGYHYASIGVAVNGNASWYGGGYCKVSATFLG